MKTPTDLSSAVKAFAELNSHYSTQGGAYLQCDSASALFINFLEAHQLGNLDVKRYEFYISDPSNPAPHIFKGGSNETGQHRASWHCIVETPEFYIDFTARQYVEDVSYPLIIPKEAAFAAKAGA